MYIKDFDTWNTLKKEIDACLPLSKQKKKIYFSEREIWWAQIGQNIGFEICGKGASSARPVLVIKKCSLDSVIVLPLTTQSKKNIFTIALGEIDGKDSYTNVSQIRLIDTRRLTDKIGTCPHVVFDGVKEKVIQFLV